MKYIDAEKLKAEIKRRIEWLSTATTDFAEGRRVEMRSLYDFIDSLQEEQPEVDLEKEINRAWEHFEKDYSPSALDKSVIIVSGLIGQKQFSRIAKYFFELGFNAIKKENK